MIKNDGISFVCDFGEIGYLSAPDRVSQLRLLHPLFQYLFKDVDCFIYLRIGDV